MPRTGRERRRTPRTNALSETADPHRHVHPARALKTRAPMTAALSSATSSPRLALGARGGRGVRRPSARWVSCASSARAREPTRGSAKARWYPRSRRRRSSPAAGAAGSEDPAGLFAKTCASATPRAATSRPRARRSSPPTRASARTTRTPSTTVYAGKNKMPGYGEGCQPRGSAHSARGCRTTTYAAWRSTSSSSRSRDGSDRDAERRCAREWTRSAGDRTIFIYAEHDTTRDDIARASRGSRRDATTPPSSAPRSSLRLETKPLASLSSRSKSDRLAKVKLTRAPRPEFQSLAARTRARARRDTRHVATARRTRTRAECRVRMVVLALVEGGSGTSRLSREEANALFSRTRRQGVHAERGRERERRRATRRPRIPSTRAT